MFSASAMAARGLEQQYSEWRNDIAPYYGGLIKKFKLENS